MTGNRDDLWFWRGILAMGLLLAIGVFLLHAWLPADGATGDLQSFSSTGFRVQWLLEQRPADTGIGMTVEQMANLFQPFSQGDAAIARDYGGSGLGLVISQRFCLMMGGDIQAESAPGQGAIFTVRLPAEVKEWPGLAGA